MYCTKRWPWRPGLCSFPSSDCCCTQPSATIDPPQVLPCHECHRCWCEDNDPPDACPICGIVVCYDCKDFHIARCNDLHGRRWSVIRCHGRSAWTALDVHARRGVIRCPLSSMPFPWIQRLRESMRCSECTSIRDLAAHSCERCEQPQCLSATSGRRLCVTAIHTRDGAGGLDVCGKGWR